MLNLMAVAQYLEGLDIGSLDSSILERHTSPVLAFSRSPALEVVHLRGKIRVFATGGEAPQPISRLRVAVLEVSIYVPLTPNQDEDMEQLTALFEAYLVALETTDPTLGGLVEETRGTDYKFGIERRNSSMYRYASVTIFAGDLDQEGA
ncbi:MAG: hypothetical protein RLZZ156_1442 [Deinococcota bacterium]|jgi:hypothetical protein